jgi:uncharacterized protein
MIQPVIPQLELPMEAIRDFCQRWGVAEFALFGSILREDFRDESDVDVLLRFDDDVRYSLFDLGQMGNELEVIFQREVDVLDLLAVEASPNYIRRREILETARVIYARR